MRNFTGEYVKSNLIRRYDKGTSKGIFKGIFRNERL